MSNTINVALGGAKESIGKAIGNEQMVAEGAATRAQAQATQVATETKLAAAKAIGSVKGVVDSFMGTEQQPAASGKPEDLRGDSGQHA
ncbi:hypothetical protein DFQ26_007935 [Actinomortierella ambigua]|nr:hypothetical protein DFQ26_007935 [Actinomortierella ambigua]